MTNRNAASADARAWLSTARAWFALRSRVLLPAALVALLLSSGLLFQPGLFDFWSPADVFLAWLEYLAELGVIAVAMVAAYWFVDAATERLPRVRRYRVLWMAAAFHAVAFAGVWATTTILNGTAPLPPTGVMLPQAIHLAIIATFLVIMDMLWQKVRRADSEAAALASGGLALAREERELQLRLLQAQIEPHFLFNTLSNVLGLLETDPDKGKSMLVDFIQYLRTSLSKIRGAATNLEQEVEIIRAYLNIYKVRMGDRLHYKIDIPAPLQDLPFPPMLLQPLVENAVKHGLESRIEGGEIVICAEAKDGILRLEVADTGPGLSEASDAGLGLANIRERLHSLYGDSAKLILEPNRPHGLKAIIEVPHAGD